MTAIAVAAALSFFIIGLIYLYIFMYSGMPEEAKYFWSGMAGWVFALIFYLAHASTAGEPITRILSGMFFVLGAVFLFMSVALNPGFEPGTRIMWLILLSIVVIVVLLFSWRLSLQAAEDEERRARRHRT